MYPNQPGYKGTDTSEQAAFEVADKAVTIRDLVPECISNAPVGMTADECAARLGFDILTIRPRVSELRQMMKVKDSKQRRKNEGGKSQVVWVRGAEWDSAKKAKPQSAPMIAAALSELCALKVHKETFGEDGHYRKSKQTAWENAFKALGLPYQPGL